MQVVTEGNALCTFRAMTKIGNILYLLSHCGTELWIFDKDTSFFGMKRRLCDKSEANIAYRKVIKYNEYLIFVPCSADVIYIYNTRDESSRTVHIPDIEISYVQSSKFSNALCIGTRVFLLPLCYPALVIIDMSNWQVSVHKEVLNEFEHKEVELFSGSYVVVEDKIYLPSAQLNIIVEIDSDTYETKLYRVGEERAWYGSISYDGECFWLTGDKRTLTKWNKIDNSVEEYDFPEGFFKKEGTYPFLESVVVKGKIVLIPQNANMFVGVDICSIGNKRIHRIMECEGIKNNYCIHIEDDSRIICLDNNKQKLFHFGETDVEDILARVQYFMKELVNGELVENSMCLDKELCGERIFSESKIN